MCWRHWRSGSTPSAARTISAASCACPRQSSSSALAAAIGPVHIGSPTREAIGIGCAEVPLGRIESAQDELVAPACLEHVEGEERLLAELECRAGQLAGLRRAPERERAQRATAHQHEAVRALKADLLGGGDAFGGDIARVLELTGVGEDLAEVLVLREPTCPRPGLACDPHRRA